MNNSRIGLKFKGRCLKQEKVFIFKNVVNFIIVYELDAYSRDLNTVFTSKVSIVFDSSSLFSILNF